MLMQDISQATDAHVKTDLINVRRAQGCSVHKKLTMDSLRGLGSSSLEDGALGKEMHGADLNVYNALPPVCEHGSTGDVIG